jgi:hypothetical protein
MSHADDAERGAKPALGGHLIIPILACGLTIYYVVSTTGLVWEARSTGLFIGAILLSLCVLQFVRFGIRFARNEVSFGLGELVADTPLNRQRLYLLLLMVAFIVTLPWVGTTLGLFLVLIASMWVMGVRQPRVLLAVAFTTAAVVHLLLIWMLGSQLPQGILKGFISFVASQF